MEQGEILDHLVELARAANIEVRVLDVPPPERGELPPRSAVCRVRDRVWVVLSTADQVEDQLTVMVEAVKNHAAPLLEGRFLPPAVRARLGLD